MKKFKVTVNNISYEVSVEETTSSDEINVKSNKNKIEELSKLVTKISDKKQNKGKVITIKAPLPGLVTDVLVNNGEKIEKGKKLVILEAMKMENTILSPVDGTISAVEIKNGTSVASEQELLQITL